MQKNILSLKLKAYRKQEGLTQEALAEQLDVSNKSISKWELGESYPSKKNMIKISEALDLSLEALMIEEQTDNNRLKKSFKYALVSYCLIFAVTLIVRAIKEHNLYTDILSRKTSEIMKIVLVNFAQNIYIALIPSIIIGLVFYFYIIPKQQTD